ncbi:MAG: hypothetical protein KDD53_09835, partial [Bdellovibrionales bacterium]|nr:hypothetical protein [Bdellovibrionales bacterium]
MNPDLPGSIAAVDDPQVLADLNHDGILDLVMVTRDWSVNEDGEVIQGTVPYYYLVDGASNSILWQWKIGSPAVAPDRYLGMSACSAQVDFNTPPDGYDDIYVSSYADFTPGELLIISGKDGKVLGRVIHPDFPHFGVDNLCVVRDVTGDGIADLITESGETTLSLFAGPVSIPESGVVGISDPVWSFNSKGTSISIPKDLDGDGSEEICVSSSVAGSKVVTTISTATGL